MLMNPLLDFTDLPRFSDISPEHVTPAVDELLKAADAALERAVSDTVPAEYDALSAVLDVATERLGRAWGAVGHLNAVADRPELRAAYNENLPKITEFYTRLGADERLYGKYKAVKASPQAATLNPARQKALSNAMRDFVLSGAELQRRGQGAIRADPGAPGRDLAEVLRACAGRHRRLRLLRHRSRARGRARRCQGSCAHRRPTGRQ